MAQSSYNQPPPEYPTYPGPGYYGQTPVGYPPYQPAYAYGGAYGQQGPQAAPAYGAGSDPYAAPAPPPAAYAYQQQEGPTAYGKPSSLPGATSAPGMPGGAQDLETASQSSDMITPDIERSIRHAFVRKVYAILSVQVAFTFGLAIAFTLVKPMRSWLQSNWWFAFMCAMIGLVLMIVVTCFPQLGRRVPQNFILLTLITGCFAMLISCGGAATENDAFFLAVGITFIVVVALTIFACQTKIDFTGCGPYIMVAMICLMMFGIFSIFWHSRVVNLVYSSLGALLFSFLLVYDTQQVVGGKHRKYQYSIDDYIFAALTLYMDIVVLFMNILSLTSNS